MGRWWQRRSPQRDARLVGRWKLVRVEGDIDVGDGIIMRFADDGTATSLLRDGAHDQLIELRYRVAGAVLVTQRPSPPGEERTRFHMEDANHLILDYGSSRLWFLRVPDAPR